MPRPPDPLVGRTIAGKFVVEAHVGSGAMGQVYRARQVALEKTVALKVLRQDLAHDEMFTARFHREAKAASRLDHPNSVRILDFGSEPDGMLYIAMEFLDGRDLQRVLVEDWPLPTPRVVDLLVQALGALVVAHDLGVVHRDLKPENIMVLESLDDEGRRVDIVKVCDFGIAKLSGGAVGATEPSRGPLTTQGLVVGTPEYMSPEQGRGDPLDARSDLYSMGVILYQLTAGRLPFTAETALGLVFKQVNEAPVPPSAVRPGLDPRIESICLRALAKSPDDRFQSAREMRAALKAAAEGRDISSAVPLPPSTTPRLLDGGLEGAETLSLSSASSTDPLAVRHPPTETSAGTAALTALPPLPVTQPSAWVVGALALLLGAGLTAFAVTRLRHAPDDAATAAANLSERLDASAGDARATPLVASSAPAPSASTTLPARSSSRPPPSAVNAASSLGPPAKAPAVAPGVQVGQAAASSSPSSSAGFSLQTSSASPTVTRAMGVSAAAVRSALPSWKFTQCYRDALTRGNKAIDGHATLALMIDGTGAVVRVGLKGAAPVVSSMGDCLIDAMNGVSVSGASPSGSSADVDIACAPR